MTAPAPAQLTTAARTTSPSANGALLLQRKCACGSSKMGIGDECTECQGKQLQRKLAVGSTNDPLEAEADRVAEQVMASPRLPLGVSHAPPRIQRLSHTAGAGGETAPPSVERALSSPGQPLEPTLRADMEQRFGHDFSRVRLHSGAEAERSARDVGALAYTVNNHIMFGRGQLAPLTSAGQRLLAHELTHVCQQLGARSRAVQRAPSGVVDVDGDDEVEWTVKADGTTDVVHGERTATIPRGSEWNATKLSHALGISKQQAAKVLRAMRAEISTAGRLLISFVQNKGNPKEYAIKQFHAMKSSFWHSDALIHPPVEGIRRGIRVPGEDLGKLELSEYAYVFRETEASPFTNASSKTAAGVQEYQHLKGGKRAGAATLPVAVVRVNARGEIIEIVAHAIPGPSEKAEAQLLKVFEEAGWKNALSTSGASSTAPEPARRSPHAQSPKSPSAQVSTRGTSTALDNKPDMSGQSSTALDIEPDLARQSPVTRTGTDTAKDLAQELDQSRNTNRRLMSLASVASFVLQGLNFLDALDQASGAYTMASSILAHGSPYAKELREADLVKDRALELANYYDVFDLRRSTPDRNSDAWQGWSTLQQLQFNFYEIERDLQETLTAVDAAQRNLAEQLSELADAVAQKASALVFSIVSTQYADAYLFADAAGRIRTKLLDAAESYERARPSIFFWRQYARATIKFMEIQLRDLGVSGLIEIRVPGQRLKNAPLKYFSMTPEPYPLIGL